MENPTAPKYGSFLSLVAAALLAVNSLGCHVRPADSEQVERMAGKTIQQVQEEHTDEWMAIRGVVGTAIGQHEGKPCILVFTASDTEQVRQKIPQTVDGYPVVVRYMGEVRAR